MRNCCFILFLVAGIMAPVLAQDPKLNAGLPPGPQDPDVVRISVKLVQVDGTVTDTNGKQITDLTKDDFELVVDGRPEAITYFAYVPAQQGSPQVAVSDRNVPPPPTPSERLRPDQVRRTIALVVANVAAENMPAVKKALKQFVDEQMQPGDLVSIIRPAEGAGVLQQLTADKKLLHLAIDGVRWSPIGGAAVSAPSPAPPPTKKETDEEKAREETRAESFHDDVVASSWVRRLDVIVRGLDGLPGRKSIILFSDGLNLLGKFRSNQRTLDALHQITDRATRSLVVFNAIDSRGLDPLMGGAAENTDLPPEIGTPLNVLPTKTGSDFAVSRQARVRDFLKAQDGLAELADETGGRFMQSTDLGRAIGRILDQKGYYLVGYRPDEATFKLEGNPSENRRPYHSIRVTVKRAGYQAHFRGGFYGVPDKERAPQQRTNVERMVAALTSPLAVSELGVRLTSLFGYDKREGPFVRSLLNVDVKDLSFSESADGWSTARIHVLAAAFDGNGLVADPVAQDQIVRERGQDLERLKQEGVIYEMTIPVKKTGVYQLRAAVRDITSDRIGSASQLVEVPDLSTKRLALSGIVLSARALAANVAEPGSQKTSGRSVGDEVVASPAIRKFRPGMQITYAMLVLNAHTDPATDQPQIETQAVLYRNGQPVFKGHLRRLDVAAKGEKELVATGSLNLGVDLGPGEYVLQVVVTDKLVKEERYRVATQSIDFDVVG